MVEEESRIMDEINRLLEYLKNAGVTSNVSPKKSNSSFEKIEQSISALHEDVSESAKVSLSDDEEDVSEFDLIDQESLISSVNHDNGSKKVHEGLEKKSPLQKTFDKIADHQSDILSSLRELSEKLDLSLNRSTNSDSSSIEVLSFDSAKVTESQCVDKETDDSVATRTSDATISEIQSENIMTDRDADRLASQIARDEAILASFPPEVQNIIRECDDVVREMKLNSVENSEKLESCPKDLFEKRVAQVKKLMIGLEACQKEREKLAIDCRASDRGEESQDEDKSMPMKEVLLLRENCDELTKKLEEVKVENEALSEELKKLADDERKSHEEQHETLMRENALFKRKSDAIQMDLEHCKAELADAREMITELQRQNDDLQEIENEIDVYKVLNKKQEIDIVRMRGVEALHIYQIQLLTDENEILRNYIKKFSSNSRENA